MNRLFLPDDALLANLAQIRHTCSIVQGRYAVPDPLCRWGRALTGAEYIVVPDAGHSARRPASRASWSRPPTVFAPGCAEVTMQWRTSNFPPP